MNRLTLLQKLVDHYNYEKFLEIGTHKGKTFLPLKCKYKIAVDPSFRIPVVFFLKQLFNNPTNLRNRYYSMTSDTFFSRKKKFLKKQGKQELIFIDGLHTFEASLNDVLNSLKYLNFKGTIVLHDCFPPSQAAATPANSLKEAAKMDIPGWTGAWCGDVWKTVLYLKEKYFQELDVFVLNTDLGLAVISFKTDQIDLTPDRDLVNRILNYKYEYLNNNPGIINLKPQEFINDYLSSIASGIKKSTHNVV